MARDFLVRSRDHHPQISSADECGLVREGGKLAGACPEDLHMGRRDIEEAAVDA